MEEPYIYTDLNEVPVRWKFYKGARLNLEQINSIITTAYENKLTTEYGDIPDYAYARDIFEKSHSIENNLWVTAVEA